MANNQCFVKQINLTVLNVLKHMSNESLDNTITNENWQSMYVRRISGYSNYSLQSAGLLKELLKWSQTFKGSDRYIYPVKTVIVIYWQGTVQVLQKWEVY